MHARRMFAGLIILTTAPLYGASVTFEKAARTGNQVSGRAAGVLFSGSVSQYSRPTINDVGEVVFTYNSGLYGFSSGTLSVLADNDSVAGTGEYPVPGRPVGTRFTAFGRVLLNNQGAVVFQGSFGQATGGPSVQSGSGLYAANIHGGGFTKIVDTFDDVPGQPVGTKFTSLTPGSSGSFSLNNSGHVVFVGLFSGTSQTGVYGSTIAGGTFVRLADSTGTVIPAGETLPFRSFPSDVFPALNNNGVVIFRGGISGLPLNIRDGVFAVPYDGSQAVKTLARRTQTSPPLSDGAVRSWGALFTGHDINDSGLYLFQHTFDPPPSSQFEGLFKANVSGPPISVVVDDASLGFQVPGQPGTKFINIHPATINESGQMGFSGLDDPPVDRGIYAADTSGSPMRLVANNATVPPGRVAPAKFSDFGGASAPINDSGNMAIAPSALNESLAQLYGLYFYNNCTSALERVVDSDTCAPAPPVGLGGTFAASGTRDIALNEGLDVRSGQLKSINNSNDIAFLTQFSPSDIGLYVAHVQTSGGTQLQITCPANATVECGSDTTPGGATGTATAKNVCSGAILVATHSDSMTDACGATGVITRTWTATEGASTVSCTQTITISDTTSPSLVGVPANVSVECDADLSAPTVTATDACGSATVSMSESQSAGSCPGTYTLVRTWTATDECGRTTAGSQTIMVADTTSPVLVGVPGNVTAECDDIPDPASVTASDNCQSPPPSVTYSESETDGDCPNRYTLTRTWTTTDACGNPANATQTITVVDTTPPALSGVPADAAVNCNAVPVAASPTADDNCSDYVAVLLSETTEAGNCTNAYTLVRAWTATDECGNASSDAQFIVVTDTGAPTLIGVPDDVAVECDHVPTAATVTATDDCAASATVAFSETRTNGACADEYTLTRTWIATDNCSNSSSNSQLVYVSDTMNPVITCPANSTRQCPGNLSVAANGSATATDNCSTVTITSSDVSTPHCGATETVARTWVAADGCGHTASCVQTIAEVDTTPPVLTVNTTPIVVTDLDCVQQNCWHWDDDEDDDEDYDDHHDGPCSSGHTVCSGDQAVTLPIGTATDSCDSSVQLTHNGPTTFPAGQTTTVTYTAVDDCGNTATANLNVTVKYGANIQAKVEKHTVGHGAHPSTTKTPIVGVTVKAYDASQGSCAKQYGLSWQNYDSIVAHCVPVATGITNSTGTALLNVPPDHYILISDVDGNGDSVPDTYLAAVTGYVHCGQLKKKNLALLIDANGHDKPGKCQRRHGSELLIFEPEYIIWDDTEQLYPFVFESNGDWGVTTSVSPPEGFVADYPELSEDVDNELAAVQFTITELGSDLVPTQTRFEIVHNGEVKAVESKVDIRLTPDYARSRGFDVHDLRQRGLIVEPKREVKPKR